MRHSTLPAHLKHTLVLLAGLGLVAPLQAMELGAASVESRWGEPLSARIPVTLAAGEVLTDECLAALAPGEQAEDAAYYLRRPLLSQDGGGALRSVHVRSREPFTEMFARLQLRIHCPGAGSVSRTYTLLPELNADLPAPPVAQAVPSAQAAAEAPSAAPPPAPVPQARPAKKRAVARHPAAATEAAPRPHFQLALSRGELDLSRVGTLPDSERELLLARQQMLDADDQMASMLAMQHHIQQLQEELTGIRQTLAELQAAAPAIAAAPATPPPVQEAAPAAAPTPAASSGTAWIWIGLLLLLAALAYAVLLFRRRQDTTFTSDEDAEDSATPPAGPRKVAGAELKSATKRVAEPNNALLELLEDAQLFALHGRHQVALEVLQDILKDHPDHEEAWLLRFSIYSATGRATDFAQAAQRYRETAPAPHAWGRVQALGRTLDAHSPLYQSESETGSMPARLFMKDNARHPLGLELVEMGALTIQELSRYLDEYDPQKDGRFGGYLVSRKLISLAQLDEALLRQQGFLEREQEEGQAVDLPSLSDMESALAHFDPQQHGNLMNYLQSRTADTQAAPAKTVPERGDETAARLEAAQEHVHHGRPSLALAILKDLLQAQPETHLIWMRLFSLLSSIGSVNDFESLAHRFKQAEPSEEDWRKVQALGRSLDSHNPLYKQEEEAGHMPSRAKRTSVQYPLGLQLADMGALSHEALDAGLKDYDPKLHGRLGGYLVAQKLITLDQLDAALMRQQGYPQQAESESAPELPELENLEAMLSGFDPKQHGNLAHYLEEIRNDALLSDLPAPLRLRRPQCLRNPKRLSHRTGRSSWISNPTRLSRRPNRPDPVPLRAFPMPGRRTPFSRPPRSASPTPRPGAAAARPANRPAAAHRRRTSLRARRARVSP